VNTNVFSYLLPGTGSHVASWWNDLFSFVMWISIFFFVLLIGITLAFVYKYHHKKVDKVIDSHGNTSLEILWTIVPTILVLFIFAWGWLVYKKMHRPPAGSFEVRVIGQQWRWKFAYNNGKNTVGELIVPVGKRIKLLMTSEDVIHSFFIPDMRVKQDVVPGLYTALWFEATKPGEHVIYCSEYCGGLHSNMLATLKVLPHDEWLEWWRKQEKTERDLSIPPEKRGEGLATKYACTSCHSVDGSALIGPSFRNLYGRTEKLTSGRSALVDEDYIRNKILKPNSDGVVGYPQVMPSFQGQISEEEIMDIIAFIKSLKD